MEERFDEVVPETAKDSAADLDADLDNVNEEQVDHSQSAPEAESAEDKRGPGAQDAFRSGS